jgi:hypothetical protein
VGVLGEDVEDHGGAVDRRSTQELLQVALLGGAELVVEHDGVHVERLAQLPELRHLARPEVGGRIRGGTALLHPGHCVRAGGVHEERELVEVALGVLVALAGPGDAHEDDPLAERALDEPPALTPELPEPAAVAVGGHRTVSHRAPPRRRPRWSPRAGPAR